MKTSKTSLGGAVALVLLASTAAAVPPGFNVQGRLTDPQGVNRNGSFDIKFSIFEHPTSPAPALWSKTMTSVSVRNGNFQATLIDPPDLPSLPSLTEVLSKPEAFLEIQLVAGHPAAPEPPLLPRQRLLRFPFVPEVGPANIVKSTGDVIINADSNATGSGIISLRTGGKERVVIGGTDAILSATPSLSIDNGPTRWHLSTFFQPDQVGAIGRNLHILSLRGPGADWISMYDGGGPLTSCPFPCSASNRFFVLRANLHVEGYKSFIQNHPTQPGKMISYYTLEGPEAGIFTRGTAQLSNGVATVDLPDHFALMASPSAPISVQVTPLGECNGLFVSQKGTSQVIVKELGAGKSNVAFDYLVQGVRTGYENLAVIQDKR